LLLILLGFVVAAMLAAGFVMAQFFDERSQATTTAQQTSTADLWARMLTARMEAHQRLLTSIAQGMHSSLLDKPAVLDALMQQDGSMLRLFESLHVALPNGSLSHHGQVGAPVELDSSGRDGLRRTVNEGKPTVVYMQQVDDTQHLHVLLSVPLRQAEGHISGALAAIVKLPVAALLPEPVSLSKDVQYMLVGSDGVVLVHSEAGQRWLSMKEVMGRNWEEWQALSGPSTANADTRLWGQVLATRVGLPLPQWQAVVLRDMSQDGVIHHFPTSLWWMLGLAAAFLTLLAWYLVWRWIDPRAEPNDPLDSLLSSQGTADDIAVTAHSPAQEESAEPLLKVQAQAMAMMEAMPSTLMLEQDGQVRMATAQLAVVLGYMLEDQERMPIARFFADAQVLQQIRDELVSQGSFEGLIGLKKRDGDTVQLNALAWTPSSLPSATVWQLRLPWRSRKVAPLPGDPHAWRDLLTGLPNREAFVWGLQSWTSESMAASQVADPAHCVSMPAQGCILFADVDHLGMINEITSREMGDKVLRYVGRLIASYTQPLGDVARLGGDEFAVLLPGISLAHAQGVAQALCDALWRWQPNWGGERHWVSISIGVVAADTLRHAANDVLRTADMACYEAKRRGRCQVAVGQVVAPRTTGDH
jgi:diguanylate cyclase (GGDEF)-like protein